MKLAVSGKGGTGKSSLSLLLAETFSKLGRRVLLVDADPDGNLADLMGIPSESIVPIVEMKDLIRERTGGAPDGAASFIKLNPKVNDIPDTYAVERNGIKLIAMGTIKSGGSGCACPANSFVRQLLRHLILERDEVVIMDMEAGIEHMGRGTAEHVDCLLIVTEPNQTGLTTAERIIRLARDLGIPNHVLIGNKIAGDEDKEFIETFAKNEKPFYIPFSRGILRMSVSPGKPREMEPAVADSLSAIIAGIQDMDTRKR